MLQQLVRQRYNRLVQLCSLLSLLSNAANDCLLSNIFQGMSSTSYCYISSTMMLHRRLDKEWIALLTEVEELTKFTRKEKRCVALHFEEIVFALPYERNVFELAHTVSFLTSVAPNSGQ